MCPDDRGARFDGAGGEDYADVFDSDGNTSALDAVIDTGFTDSLMINETLAQSLRLPRLQAKPYEMGDGSRVEFSRYALDILWRGRRRTVIAVGSDAAIPLVGMKLLYGHFLLIEVVDGGIVRVLGMD